jgi:hypothetical protein
MAGMTIPFVRESKEYLMANFLSITDLVRSHIEGYQRLVWFVCEAAEREHRLNLDALSRTPAAFMLAWVRIATMAARPAGFPGLTARSTKQGTDAVASAGIRTYARDHAA